MWHHTNPADPSQLFGQQALRRYNNQLKKICENIY
jgi:hypothetical protein